MESSPARTRPRAALPWRAAVVVLLAALHLPPPALGAARSRPTITIALAGDLMLGRIVAETIATRGHAYPWGTMRPHLRAADVAIGNLECALTRETREALKKFRFRADPEAVGALADAGFDAVSLANNHVLDFGVAGLCETLETLDRAGIARAGAGDGRREAWAPALLERKGIRIGVLGLTDNERSWAAGEATPGTAVTWVQDPRALAAVEALEGTVDLTIVSLHWGGNYDVVPPERHVRFARALVDAGADIIHGHSSHGFQGAEVYKKRLILYGTGDFVDDYPAMASVENDLTFLFVVTADARGPLRLELVPGQIVRTQVNVAEAAEGPEGDARRRALELMRLRSMPLRTRFRDAPAGLELRIR